MKPRFSTDTINRLIRISLVGAIIYFSQIYPHLHFHHAHDDSSTIATVEHIADNAGSHHTHHGHDDHSDSHESRNGHHHPDFSQHVDWHIVRASSHSTVSLVIDAPSAVAYEIDCEPRAQLGRLESAPLRLPEAIPIETVQLRGPPVLI